MRKWLNISARDPEYGADTEDESENDDVGEENQDSSSDEGLFLLSESSSSVLVSRLSNLVSQIVKNRARKEKNRFNQRSVRTPRMPSPLLLPP